jgi:hypothetical protein
MIFCDLPSVQDKPEQVEASSILVVILLPVSAETTITDIVQMLLRKNVLSYKFYFFLFVLKLRFVLIWETFPTNRGKNRGKIW